MIKTNDINTLSAFGNLQGSPVREFIRAALADIDSTLRRAEGEKYRVMQGQAQVLEEMAAMIDGADELIRQARGQATPKSRQF